MTEQNTEKQNSDSATPPTDSTMDPLVALQKQADEYLNGWKRAKADLLNFQRESEKRQRDLAVFAHAGAVLAFLPLLESIEIACDHIPDDQAMSEWGKGFLQLRKQCSDLLKTLDVERIETIGTPFSVELHEAVGSRPQQDSSPGTIIEEVQAGYRMHGKVLRPAKVIITEEIATTIAS